MCTIPMQWILGRFFRPTVNVAWDEAQETDLKTNFSMPLLANWDIAPHDSPVIQLEMKVTY